MPLYNDPKLIKMVRTRERRGLSCKAIEAERERLREERGQ